MVAWVDAGCVLARHLSKLARATCAKKCVDDEEESKDSDMMEDDEESSEEEFPEDSFEAKYGEPRIEVLEETIQEPALPEVKRKGKKAKSEKESSNKTSM